MGKGLAKRVIPRDLVVGAATALIAMIIGAVCMQVTHMDLDVWPSLSGGDGNYALYLIKSIQEYGIKGAYMNYRAGAPGVSALVDMPVMDTVMIVTIWVLDLLTKSPTKTFYLYYFLTYAVTAGAMYFLLMKFEVKWWINSTASLLFALAPFHFFRSLGHSSLTNYMTVPLGIYLAYVICKDNYTYTIRKQSECPWKGVKLFCLAAFLGLSYVYYAFFNVILIASALLIKCLRKKSARPLLYEGRLLLVVLAFVLVGLLPQIYYTLANGANTMAGHRLPHEAELFGMSIICLLLPSGFSHFELFQQMHSTYATTTLNPSERVEGNLGVIASVCFLLLCGWLIYSFIAKPAKTKKREQMDFLAFSTLVLLLWCTIGGFGTIFNYMVTPEIRCYNRGSIVISCLALAAAAVMLNEIHRDKLVVGVCIVSLGVGLYDQTMVLSPDWQELAKAAQAEYEVFFKGIEDSLPAGAMIYNLPYTDFPESPALYDMLDYSSFTGYLFTDTIRWSYGGVRGRNTEAKLLNVDDGESLAFLDGLADAGFSGVLIDTFGYEDATLDILPLYQALGFASSVSPDGRLFYYALGDWANNPNRDYVEENADDIRLMGYLQGVLGYDAAADPEGLQDMIAAIRNRDLDGMQSIWSLVEDSAPVTDSSDEDYVAWIYQTVLGRGVDEAGLENYTALLAKGASRKDLFLSLFLSEEFRAKYGLPSSEETPEPQEEEPAPRDIEAFAAALLALKGETPDAAASQAIADKLRAGDEASLAEVWAEIADTEPVRTLSDADFVAWAYRTVLGRNVDEEGTQEYTEALAQGMSRQRLFEILLTSDEFRGKYDLPAAVETPEPQEAPKDIEAFAAALLALKGKTPDAAASQAVADKLRAGDEASLAEVWTEIADTEPVRTLSDADFVAWAYRTVLGREVDEEGTREYTEALAQGMSRQRLFEVLLTSDEFRGKYDLPFFEKTPEPPAAQEEEPTPQDIEAFAAALLALKGETPDAAASQAVADKLRAGDETSLAEVWAEIADTEPVRTLSDADFVAWAYRTVLGREVDEEGTQVYTKALAQGESRQQVFTALLTSDEFCGKYELPE